MSDINPSNATRRLLAAATLLLTAGNHHRLITAIHYDTGKIFILQILTHSEYSKNRWKKSL